MKKKRKKSNKLAEENPSEEIQEDGNEAKLDVEEDEEEEVEVKLDEEEEGDKENRLEDLSNLQDNLLEKATG